jgi:hypothetical protein
MVAFLVGVERIHLGHVRLRVEWRGNGRAIKMRDILDTGNRFAIVGVTGAVHRIGWEMNWTLLSWAGRATFRFKKALHGGMIGLRNIVPFRLKELVQSVRTEIEQPICKKPEPLLKQGLSCTEDELANLDSTLKNTLVQRQNLQISCACDYETGNLLSRVFGCHQANATITLSITTTTPKDTLLIIVRAFMFFLPSVSSSSGKTNAISPVALWLVPRSGSINVGVVSHANLAQRPGWVITACAEYFKVTTPSADRYARASATPVEVPYADLAVAVDNSALIHPSAAINPVVSHASNC